jgi:hypothetical protein
MIDSATFLPRRLPAMWSVRKINHRSGQSSARITLVGEHHTKERVDRAQQAAAEIRFLPRLDGIDVRGPEDVNTGEPGRESCVLCLSLVACEGKDDAGCG